MCAAISSPVLPSTFSDRIAFLRNNQAKAGKSPLGGWGQVLWLHVLAGMAPVELKKSAHSDRRQSSEERRMARVIKPEDQVQVPTPLPSPPPPPTKLLLQHYYLQMESSSATNTTLSPLHQLTSTGNNNNNNNNITYSEYSKTPPSSAIESPTHHLTVAEPHSEEGGEEGRRLREKKERYQQFDDFLAGGHGTAELRKRAPTTLV